jgi:Uma2 family endonuclease
VQTTTHLITYEESLGMPENKLEEILDGESKIMPPPTSRHRAFLRKLAQELERIVSELDVCREPYGLGIRRAPFRYRVPDITVFPNEVFSRDIFDKAADPYIWTAPILIAECLSPSNRKGNVTELLADYASIGAPEVWLFYPEKRLAQKYLLENSKMQLNQTTETGFISPEGTTGTIALAELWRAFHGS